MITLEELKIGVNVNWGIETENLICVVTRIKFWTFHSRLHIRYNLYPRCTSELITGNDYNELSEILGSQIKNEFGLIGLNNFKDAFSFYLHNPPILPTNDFSFPIDDTFMIQFDPYYKWATGNG